MTRAGEPWVEARKAMRRLLGLGLLAGAQGARGDQQRYAITAEQAFWAAVCPARKTRGGSAGVLQPASRVVMESQLTPPPW